MSEILEHLAAVTPSNTAVAVPIKRLYVGVSGNVVVRSWEDRAANVFVTYQAVPAGKYIELKIDTVATTTTAGGLVGEW